MVVLSSSKVLPPIPPFTPSSSLPSLTLGRGECVGNSDGVEVDITACGDAGGVNWLGGCCIIVEVC